MAFNLARWLLLYSCLSVLICTSVAVQQPHLKGKLNEMPENLARTVFGPAATPFMQHLKELSDKHPELREESERLEHAIAKYCKAVLGVLVPTTASSGHSLAVMIGQHIEDPVLESAMFDTKPGPVDISFLLTPMIVNGALRISTGFPMFSLMGGRMGNPGSGGPITVSAVMSGGVKKVFTARVADSGYLEQELYISNTIPNPAPPKDTAAYNTLLKEYFSDKKGLELGGPTLIFEDIYAASTVDLINFSNVTLWGEFQDGATKPGGRGSILIMDGSHLSRIPDNSYDFTMGSHYLEHLLNPLQALASMHRVLRRGGVALLILPNKDFCFDHRRGVGRMEDILFRYIHKVEETDMRYANIKEVTMMSDITKDRAAKNYQFFLRRCLHNSRNRGIHQFVYNLELLEKLARVFAMEVVFSGVERLNVIVALKKM
jgi:SAM-dependent methyltransferase